MSDKPHWCCHAMKRDDCYICGLEDEVERLRDILGRWVKGEAGCGDPACNIGGGPCSECGQVVYEALKKAREELKP